MKLITETSRPASLGAMTALIAAIAVLLLCGLFELVTPAHDLAGSSLGIRNHNFRLPILYATAGGGHTLLSIFGALFLLLRLKAEQPKLELQKTVRLLQATFVGISAAVLILCYLNVSVVQQSYFQTVLPLEGDYRFGFLLGKHRIPLLGAELETFAVIPLMLVLFGIFFSVIACFWMAHRSIDFLRKADDLQPAEVADMKRGIVQLVTLMAVVFTTSTLSTIVFLQIGRDWLESSDAKTAYIQNGYAMAIFWSVCFTTIFLVILIVPLLWIAIHTRRLQRQAKYADRKTAYFDQIYEVISYKFLAQLGTAVISPIITSSIAAALGS